MMPRRLAAEVLGFLQIIDVIDTHLDLSQDVPELKTSDFSFTRGLKSDEPYPRPATKSKVELDAGALPVQEDTIGYKTKYWLVA
jgi:hypothetical protein